MTELVSDVAILRNFDQVAITVVPFITDHLLLPAVRVRKQLAEKPFQVVQKPSFVSFQVLHPLNRIWTPARALCSVECSASNLESLRCAASRLASPHSAA